jgi:hypothetical protein
MAERNMNGMKKWMGTAALLAVLALGALTEAQACYTAPADWYPYDITDLKTFMKGAKYTDVSGTALTGMYDVTALAYQSYLTDQFRDSSQNVLFTNNLTSGYGTKTADLTSASFRTTGLYGNVNLDFVTLLTDASRVRIYELTKDWVQVGLTAGTLIIGMNDDGIKNPCTDDFDDFILAASRAAPTPVPGAVWLLGSGLLGLAGFKRARKRA